MNKIYIVRHGKTDWNELGLLQGKTDIELNKEGIKQAIELREKIDLSNIDVCICSPLKRTKQTAEIIIQNRMPIQYDDMLVERCFGDYEGKPIDFSLIGEQWDYKKNDSSCNIESLQDCLARAKKFVDKINKEYDNKNILIVSHGGFIKALHFCLVGYDENTDFLSFNPKNAVLYEYTTE